MKKNMVAKILSVLLVFILFFGTVNVPAARADDVNLPPLPPGIPVEGWDELGLILNLYTTWCGRYSSKAPYGAKLDASKSANIMFLLSKLISKMPGPVQWAFFAKEMGQFTGTSLNYGFIKRGFASYKELRQNILASDYVNCINKNGVLDMAKLKNSRDIIDAELTAYGHLRDAIAYVLYGSTEQRFLVTADDFIRAAPALEMAYLGEKWREKYHQSGWWEGIKNFVFGTPIPVDFNPWDKCPRNPATEIRGSWDPNNIEIDPSGVGNEKWISADQALRVVIHFENMATATAEAQDIRIVMPLDPALDPNSLRADDSSYPDASMVYDERSGKLQWFLPGINLRPNVNPPEGEGWVAFTVSLKSGVSPGTEVQAWADIYFDYNPPVRTPEVVRTVAGLPEVSGLSAGVSSDGTVTATWATYAPQGVLYYELYRVSDDGFSRPWVTTAEPNYSFKGVPGTAYKFAARVVDLLGQESSLSAPVVVTVPKYTGTSGGGAGGGYTTPVLRAEKHEEVVKPVTFDDIGGHWAEKIIRELAGQALVSGYPDGTFKPDNEITRAEVAAILARALKLAPGKEENLKFADSAAIPTWAKGAVAAAAKEGLVKGYPQPDGTTAFEADRPVSRVEMAVLAVRALERKSGPTAPAELKFNDADAIPHWARANVGTALAVGIVVGYPDNTFRPGKPVTRAEAAAMILRLLEALGSK